MNKFKACHFGYAAKSLVRFVIVNMALLTSKAGTEQVKHIFLLNSFDIMSLYISSLSISINSLDYY